MNMHCHEELATLYRYLDHELTPEEQVEFELHLEECCNCLARYRYELHFYTVVCTRLQQDQVPLALVKRIRLALDSAD